MDAEPAPSSRSTPVKPDIFEETASLQDFQELLAKIKSLDETRKDDDLLLFGEDEVVDQLAQRKKLS